MIAIIAAGLQLLLLLVSQWFKFTDEKKQKAKEILKDVPNAKTASDFTAIFDRINRI